MRILISILSFCFLNTEAHATVVSDFFGKNLAALNIPGTDVEKAFEIVDSKHLKLLANGSLSFGPVKCENIQGADFWRGEFPEPNYLIQLPSKDSGFCKIAGLRFLKSIELKISLSPIVVEIGQNSRLKSRSEREQILDLKSFHFGSNSFLISTLKKVGLEGADVNELQGLPNNENDLQDLILNKAFKHRGMVYPQNTIINVWNLIVGSVIFPPGKSVKIKGIACSSINFAGFCTLAMDHTFATGVTIPAGTEVQIWTDELEDELDPKISNRFSRAAKIRGREVKKGDCISWTKRGEVTYLSPKDCVSAPSE